MVDTTEYFASYGLMQGGGTNPLGHAFLLISKYDPALPNAQVEVLSATGLYSTPVPKENTWRKQLFGVYFFGNGHVKDEEFRDLVNLDPQNRPIKLDHKTWAITKDEYTALKKGIEEDRGAPLPDRDFAQEALLQKNLLKMPSTERRKQVKAQREAQLKMKGPYFRIHDNSCKTDALKRLRKIGIESAGDLHNPVADIPIYSGQLAKLELTLNKHTNKLTWKSPLTLSPRATFENHNPQEKTRIAAHREFALLKEGVAEIYTLFNKKIADLNGRGKIIPPITEGHAAIKALYDDINAKAAFPFQIERPENRQAWMNTFKTAVQKCQIALEKQNDDPEIIKFLRELTEIINSIFSRIASIFIKVEEAVPSEFGLASKANAHVKNLEERIKNIKI